MIYGCNKVRLIVLKNICKPIIINVINYGNEKLTVITDVLEATLTASFRLLGSFTETAIGADAAGATMVQSVAWTGATG